MPQNCFRSFLVQAVSYRWPFPTEGRFLWQAVSYAWPTTLGKEPVMIGLDTLLDCVSFLRRGHNNFLCIGLYRSFQVYRMVRWGKNHMDQLRWLLHIAATVAEQRHLRFECVCSF